LKNEAKREEQFNSRP